MSDDDAKARADGRIVPLTQAAKLLGRDKGTVRAWVDRGCPVHSRPQSNLVLVDLAAVVLWREQELRAEGEERGRRLGATSAAVTEIAGDGTEGATPADEHGFPKGSLTPKDLLTLEQLKLTKLKLAREGELAIPRDLPEASFERAMGLLRQSMLAIPERITREMSGFPEDHVIAWRSKALAYVRANLVEAAGALRQVVPGFVVKGDDGEVA